MDSSEFEFKKWTEEYELEDETVKLLMDLGFKSYKSLSKLTEESCKKLFSRMITPGQYVLLEAGLEMLRPTTGQASSLAPQPDPTPMRTAPTEVSQEGISAQQGPAQDAVGLATLLHGLPHSRQPGRILSQVRSLPTPFVSGQAHMQQKN